MLEESDDVVIKLIETPDNYNGKIEMFDRYKNINTFTKSLVNSLNALSVCNMVLTFTPVSYEIIILALSSTSVSAIVSATHSSSDVEGKLWSHNTSYLQ